MPTPAAHEPEDWLAAYRMIDDLEEYVRGQGAKHGLPVAAQEVHGGVPGAAAAMDALTHLRHAMSILLKRSRSA